MPLGNPIRKQNESRMVSVLATEGQTVFTVQGGYIINHISVFRNGVRLSHAEDFTAGDGSTVTLNNAANIDDRIDFHIFDRFTVQNAIVGAASSQTISGDVVVTGKIFGNLDVPSINTGIVTATQLDLNGSLDVSSTSVFNDDITLPDQKEIKFGASSDLRLYHNGHSIVRNDNSGAALFIASHETLIANTAFDETQAKFVADGAVELYYNNGKKIETSPSGVDITGTLNVTGISTFGGAINGNLTGNVTGNVTGNISGGTVAGSTGTFSGAVSATTGTFTSEVDIADKIIHTGDTDTAIRFPNANVISFETAGADRFALGTNEVVVNDPGNDIDFRVEGDSNANLFKVDAGNDRVGVGLAAPQQVFHVYHASDNGLALFESGDTQCRIDLKDNSGQVSVEAIGDQLRFGTSSSNTERLRITSQGKVLVNTITASSVGNSQYSRLEVSGNSSSATGPGHLSLKRGTVSTSLSSGDTLARLIFSSLDGGDYAYIQASVDGSPGSADFPGRIMFFTCADDASSATERLRINSEGAIHINDGSATAARFDIGNGGDLKLFHTNPGSYIQDGSSALSISSARIDLASPSGENMARFYQDAQVELYHNNVLKLQTLSTGVKIISASSSNGLFVHHSNGNEVARLAHNGSGDEGVMQLRDSNAVTISLNAEVGQVCHISGPHSLMLGTGGNGVGNTQRGIQLSAVTSGNPVLMQTSSSHYTSGAYSHWYIYDDHGRVGYVNADGDGTASYNSDSDYRLKENVVPITDGIEKLKTLKPYRFNFIGYDTSKVLQGFYAHEVSVAVPNAVKGTKDEMKSLYYEEGDTIPDGKAVGDFKEYSTTEMNPQGLDHAKMVPMLTAALQEAIAKIETLETKVAALEGS